MADISALTAALADRYRIGMHTTEQLNAAPADRARQKLPATLLILLATGLFTITAVAQMPRTRPPNTYHPAARPTAPPVATELHPDGTITFRLRAPDATHVDVIVDGLERTSMAKGADGVWSVLVGPVEPELHRYSFSVDGVSIADPTNVPATVGTPLGESYIEVPGSPARFDESQDVPHGVLQLRDYMSSAMKLRRHLVVWVPPGYDGQPARRFPVLYLKHGSGGTEADWSSVGRAGVILENLLAKRDAVPMIIVMPNGNPAQVAGSSPDGIEEIGQELITDIIPLIEHNYRVIADRDHRAIAGLSMGAGQSFITGLKHPALFAYVGAFSSGAVGDAGFRLRTAVPGFLDSTAAVSKRLRLLFLSCGEQDPRYPGHLDLVDTLAAHQIRHEWFSTPGRHEFKVWRHSLAAMLPRLFRAPHG